MSSVTTSAVTTASSGVSSEFQFEKINTKDYLNKCINEIIMNYFSFLNPKEKKTIRTLFFGISILIGIDVFKTIVYALIIDNKKQICDMIVQNLKNITWENFIANFLNIYNFFRNFIFNFVLRLKKSKQSKQSDHFEPHEFDKFEPKQFNQNPSIKIKLQIDNVFHNNFINLLELHQSNLLNYDNTKITKINYDVEHENLIMVKNNTVVQNKIYKNISIEYDDVLMKFNDIYHIVNKHDKMEKSNKSNKSNKFDDDEIIKVLSTQYEYINKYIASDMALIFPTPDTYQLVQCEQLYGNEHKIKEYEKKYIFIWIYDRIKKFALQCKTYTQKQNIYNNIAAIEVAIQSFYSYGTKYFNSKFHTKISDIYKKIPDLFKNNLHFKIYNQITCNSKYNILYNNEPPEQIIKLFDVVAYCIESFDSDDDFQNINTDAKCDELEIEIQSSFESNQFDISDRSDKFNECKWDVADVNIKKIANEKVNDFVKKIDLFVKNKVGGKKINIYTILIKENINENIIANSEYEDYMKSKEKYVNEKKTEEEIKLLLPVEPSKTITTIAKTKIVEKKLINSKYHSFDNLYLRKKQDVKLFDIIERFKNDKLLMQELDIPNKLGILLYGSPGCGKTTTIVSIASYFGRDIFYVNLKSIKTNEELKMIFDYANFQHTGGSIIVFEDIDAMTNLVKKRTENQNENDKCEITLEYLLNLLDGTLTHDDLITIITTNHLEYIDPALYRPGRMDNLICMKLCDHYQIKKIFKRFIRREIKQEVLEKIKEDKYSPAEIIFHLINWIKLRDEPDENIMNLFIEK